MLTSSLNWNLVLLVFFGSPVLYKALVQHCYTCGPNDKINCDNFNSSNKSIFVKECPPDAQSCSIQRFKNTITRSCENIKLDDCKTANNIEYCYCSQNLCNNMFIIPTDDEDLLEGSGIKIVTTAKTTNPVVQITKTNTANALIIAAKCYYLYLPVFINMVSIFFYYI